MCIYTNKSGIKEYFFARINRLANWFIIQPTKIRDVGIGVHSRKNEPQYYIAERRVRKD